jgi:hypothetical protein
MRLSKNFTIFTLLFCSFIARSELNQSELDALNSSNKYFSVLTDNVGDYENDGIWQYTVVSSKPKQYLNFNGWRYAYRSGGEPTFKVENSSTTAKNLGLKIEINNSVSGVEHSSYWYKDFTITVPLNALKHTVRMKINDENAGADNWESNFFIKYREQGTSSWSSSVYSNKTSVKGWRDSVATFEFPDIGAETVYQVRIYPRLKGKGNGSVQFDDLEIFNVCGEDDACIKTNTHTISSCLNGENREIIVLEPTFGSPGDQQYYLQSQLNAITAQCAHIELNHDYLLASNGKRNPVLSLPELNDYVVTGDGSITLTAHDTLENEDSDYRTVFALTGNSDNAAFSGITVDHNAQLRLLNSYDSKSGADLRSTFSSYSFALGYGNISYKNLTIKNADSVVSLYNNRHYDANANILGRAEQIIIDNVAWQDATNHGIDYDQSYVNADTDYGELINSSAHGESWENAPRTAFEPHFRAGKISNNVINKFQVGINLAGISRAGTAYNLSVLNNEMYTSRNGILIWSQPLAPAYADIGIDGALIDNNTIKLLPNKFQFYTPQVQKYRVGTGIYFYSGRNFTNTNNIVISNNTIEYLNEDFSYLLQNNSKYAGAIGGYNFNYSYTVGNNTEPALVDGLTITNNTVKNCEAAAIYFYLGKINNLNVSNNTFDNCGNFIQDGSQFWYSKNFIVYIHNKLYGSTVIENNLFINQDASLPTHDIFVRDRETSSTLVSQPIATTN